MNQPVTDVAVIGAGIIGTCIAERLVSQGKQVVLIDRDGPGNGCSKGNAGHFASDIILPLANFSTLTKVPRMLFDPDGPLTIRWSYLPRLMPWLLRFAWAAMPHNSQQTIAALKRLNRPSIERFSALLTRTGLTELMTKRGALTVYQSHAAAQENRQHAELVRSHGVRVEQLDARHIRELEPTLSRQILGGLYYPDTAHSVDPYRLVTGLAEHFSRHGGQMLINSVRGITLNNDATVKLFLDDRELTAKQVVIACGAYSKPLVETLGYRVPLESERGYHLMLPSPGASLTRPVSSFEKSFVMTPMREGLRLAGTVELAGLDAPPNVRRATNLYQHAQAILPALDNRNASHWMGHRPSLPDSLPVIGRSPRHRAVFFAFGHQHLGLTQAAVTADLISQLIVEKEIPAGINAFRVDRF